MNREIKFRAWDKKNKIMYQVVTINFRTEPVTFGLGFRENPYLGVKYPSDIEVMQYTGLFDKNGKQIYEGDIMLTDEAGWIAPVVFKGGEFLLWRTKEQGSPGFSSECNWKSFEVIGNIYENPELIAESKGERDK